MEANTQAPCVALLPLIEYVWLWQITRNENVHTLFGGALLGNPRVSLRAKKIQSYAN